MNKQNTRKKKDHQLQMSFLENQTDIAYAIHLCVQTAKSQTPLNHLQPRHSMQSGHKSH